MLYTLNYDNVIILHKLNMLHELNMQRLKVSIVNETYEKKVVLGPSQ